MESLLNRKDRVTLEDGTQLRLLSALEVLEARREGEELAQGEGERALCANACLLARAVRRGRRPVYPDGRAVLKRLTAEEIELLAGDWWAWSCRVRESPRAGEGTVQARKKACSTRRMSAFTGAC